MRPWFTVLLLGWCLVSSGCALIEDGTRNTILSIKAPLERHSEWTRDRQWADEAWQRVCLAEGSNRSTDYAAGFKDGFAEYLFWGGDGEPPLVAPLQYRRLRYQTAEGYAAVADWFAGYRHGVAVAKASGARQWVTGPSALAVGRASSSSAAECAAGRADHAPAGDARTVATAARRSATTEGRSATCERQ